MRVRVERGLGGGVAQVPRDGLHRGGARVEHPGADGTRTREGAGGAVRIAPRRGAIGRGTGSGLSLAQSTTFGDAVYLA